jgi:ribonuclease HI
LFYKFEVILKPPKPQIIKEVLWHPPLLNCIKSNIDGTSARNPGNSACGGLFRNADFEFLGAFAINLGFNLTLNDELVGAMTAIEIAFSKNCLNLWLETDFGLGYLAFKNVNIVTWNLRKGCSRCGLVRF